MEEENKAKAALLRVRELVKQGRDSQHQTLGELTDPSFKTVVMAHANLFDILLEIIDSEIAKLA